MYIDQVTIEGFKSYATRTVIGKWDPKFNAITGLNGTGKSNILDAICFVLGLTNLAHVRASKLEDLVYKRGQAGINKASVTIEFNNSDKERSVPKYAELDTISVTRQIIIGGKNKYMINGKNATQEAVGSMFQAIQLNINNPNFLIMQGKITQVLNMKPQQILGLVEEAAGTSLYENRKNKALKAIEGKDSKLIQNEQLIETEITPKLDELREKKRVLLEFQKIQTEKEHLEKVLIAHEFCRLSDAITNSSEKRERMQERIKHLTKMQKILEEELVEIKEQTERVTQERLKNGGSYFELEEQLKVLSKDIQKLNTQRQFKNTSIEELKQQQKDFEVQQAEVETTLEDKKTKTAQLEQKFEGTMKEYDENQQYVTDTENLLQTLTTGLTSTKGKENGYMDQLITNKKELSTTNDEINKLKIRLVHIEKELKTEEPKAKKAKKDNQALVQEIESNKNVLKMVSDELDCFTFDPLKEDIMVNDKIRLEKEVKDLKSKIDDIESNLNGLNFSYSDPCPNFDRKKVRGLVANLITIPNEHEDKANALEVCAGGKLKQIVVDTGEVVTQLLQNGRLPKRYTFIPLDKIKGYVVAANRVDQAKRLAPGKVDLALNLIDCEKSLEAMSHFVFGATLVYPATAKLVTFDKGVNLRSVTVGGDVYDPSGQLSGGAKSQSSGCLLKMQCLKEMSKDLERAERELLDTVSKLQAYKIEKQNFMQLKSKKEMKEHEFGLLQKRMGNNPHFKVIQHVEKLIEDHTKSKEEIKALKENLVEIEQKIQKIEKEMSEFNDNREDKLEKLQKGINERKKLIKKLEPTVGKMKEEIMLAKEEGHQIVLEIERLKNGKKLLESEIEQTRNDELNLGKEVDQTQERYNGVNLIFLEEKKTLFRFDKELKSLELGLVEKTQGLEDKKLEATQIQVELEGVGNQAEQMKHKFEKLQKENKWIKDQKQYLLLTRLFGTSGTMYDFTTLDITESTKRISHLSKSYAELERKVDPTALEKYDRVESKETKLKQNLRKVKNDKSSITTTLEYLDRKKLDKLTKTLEKVSEDFGGIFGDLLPGNTCKLVPIDSDITKGLEVRVSLGGVWKTSLTELSGGQRSLIALSLILALLQFNPAPMYILDEIDAALDLSHTQNIGKLLKNRFKTSQFIIVSLKDGMFNNANVLFRTKFVDGVSKVDRKEQKSGKSVAAAIVPRVPVRAN